MMAISFGALLILAGIIQLLIPQRCIDLKRQFKPWWSDQDPARDAMLLRMLRVMTFAGAIVYVELGLLLAGLSNQLLLPRVACYWIAALVTWGYYWRIRNHELRSNTQPMSL